MANDNHCDSSTCPVVNGYFNNAPSAEGALILLAVFSALCLANLWVAFRSKARVWAVSVAAGILLEVMAYSGRVMLKDDLRNTRYFTLWLCGTTLGPTVIAGALFTSLPHIVNLYGADLCTLPSPLWFVYIFLGFDAFILAFQGVGSTYTTTGTNAGESQQGVYILVVSFAVQIFSLVAFLAFLWIFLLKVSRHKQFVNRRFQHVFDSACFKLGLAALSVAALLILVRTASRLGQLLGGLESQFSQSETLTLTLDGGSIAMATILLTVFSPSYTFGQAWNATSPDRKKARGHLLALQQRGTTSPLFNPHQRSPLPSPPQYANGAQQLYGFPYPPMGQKMPLSPPPTGVASSMSGLSSSTSGQWGVTAPRRDGVGIQKVARNKNTTDSRTRAAAAAHTSTNTGPPPYEKPAQHYRRVPFVPPAALVLGNNLQGRQRQQHQQGVSPQYEVSPPLQSHHSQTSPLVQRSSADGHGTESLASQYSPYIEEGSASGSGPGFAGRGGRGMKMPVQEELVQADDVW